MLDPALASPTKLVNLPVPEAIDDPSMAEVNRAIVRCGSLPDHRPKLIVKYAYDPLSDRFHTFIGDDGGRQFAGIVVDDSGALVRAAQFLTVYRYFRKRILEFYDKSAATGDLDDLFTVLKGMTHFFISPIARFLRSNTHLIMKSEITINGDPCHTDFSFLFNLRYRFALARPDEDFVVTTVTIDLGSFVHNLAAVRLPRPASLHILNGFPPGHPAVNSAIDAALGLACAEGSTVTPFEKPEDFLSLLEKGREGTFIILLAHFDSTLGVIKTRKNSIDLGEVISSIEILKKNGHLRDDAVLDLTCCNSFRHFRKLYECGVRVVYSYHNEPTILLAAAMLHELYSGDFAQSLGWRVPYLDGATYLHEAWGKVLRSFYTKSQVVQPVQLAIQSGV